MLGRYPPHNGFVKLEFQIERTLVWIRLRPKESESKAIVQGNEILPTVWSEIPRAVTFAEARSREIIPEFWVAQDSTTAVGPRLAVWSVMLTPETGDVCYDVSCNHDFFGSNSKTYAVLDVDEEKPIDLPEFPTWHHVHVVRSLDGAWSIASSA